MAAIPKRATYFEKILLNSLVTNEIIDKAKKALEEDFEPISDMRASRKYRIEVAKNLLEKNEIVQHEVISEFGTDIINTTGKVDKNKLKKQLLAIQLLSNKQYQLF